MKLEDVISDATDCATAQIVSLDITFPNPTDKFAVITMLSALCKGNFILSTNEARSAAITEVRRFLDDFEKILARIEKET